MNRKDKREFHQKIMEYYHKKIQNIFKVIKKFKNLKMFKKMIGTLSNESSKSVDELQNIEFNIRACIFRELSFQGSKELEKSLYENYSNLNIANSTSIEGGLKSVSESLSKPNIQNIDPPAEDEDFVPLTKENLEIHQKRYEFIENNKVNSNKNSKKSQSPICINENLANYLKSPSKNNDEDESKNLDSAKGKTISASNEENYRKELKKSRLAIIPLEKIENENDSKKENSKENNNEEIKFETNESKSESNTPKFSKLQEETRNFEELIIEKSYPINQNTSNISNKSNNLKNNEKTEKIDKNENEKTEKIEKQEKIEKNQQQEKIEKNDKKKINNNINFIAEANENIPNNETEKSNFSKIKGFKDPKMDLISKEKDKKSILPPNKNSTSSTARPSNSLTNTETQPQPTMKTTKPLANKQIMKTKIPAKIQPAAQLQYFKNKKISLINKILIYYSSTLFLLRRYNECNKMLSHGLQLSEKLCDKLAYANFKRISGSVQYIKKNFQQALKEFGEAEEVFKEVGCSLGIAIAQAALGFIKYLEGIFF